MQFKETVVSGGPEDFMEVRHLLLKGSNYEIGRKLGEIAKERHDVHLDPWPYPVVARSQREYLKRNYPIHLERMRGVADVYGAGLDDDTVWLSGLFYNMGLPACSVVYYPPQTTSSGHGVLSRNYDFPTGTLAELLGNPRPPGAKPWTAEPYIMEVYPDEGYPALYLVSYDLLGGCLDGVNSEGLTVALMSDNETPQHFPIEPAYIPAVGNYEIQILRLLLDTCANVEEAKQAFLTNKHYFVFVPCHYVVADRKGESFVWEYSHAQNREHIIDGKGKPQAATNHMLHRYQSADDMPREDDMAASTYTRYRTLLDRMASVSDGYTADFIRETNRCVSISPAMLEGITEVSATNVLRTLWHALYDTEDRSLQISFYRRDGPGSKNPDKESFVYSDYYQFQLKDS